MKYDWIDKLAKFSHDNPGVLDNVHSKCPNEFGLADDVICNFDYCGTCWERALDAYTRSGDNK